MTTVSLTRRALFGAFAAGAALAPATAAQPAGSDVEILEQLLVLEQRLEAAYEAGLRRDVIDRPLGELLRDQEQEHIRALEQVMRELGGGRPSATAPEPELGVALSSRARFARFALDLEERATAAYADAASGVRRPGLRRPLGSIMACEAAHEVALRSSAGLDLLPRGVA